MLAETDHLLDVIAREPGFGTEATTRKSFQRVLCISPLDYRERFS
ncbi:hypothetical protein [Streptomyces tendae]